MSQEKRDEQVVKNANADAFPFTGEGYEPTSGLTKREYIATMIMAGSVAPNLQDRPGHESLWAERAVAMADALLQALEEITPTGKKL